MPLNKRILVLPNNYTWLTLSCHASLLYIIAAGVNFDVTIQIIWNHVFHQGFLLKFLNHLLMQVINSKIKRKTAYKYAIAFTCVTWCSFSLFGLRTELLEFQFVSPRLFRAADAAEMLQTVRCWDSLVFRLTCSACASPATRPHVVARRKCRCYKASHWKCDVRVLSRCLYLVPVSNNLSSSTIWLKETQLS